MSAQQYALELIEKGFSPLISILTPEEITNLTQECLRLLAQPALPWNEYQKIKFSAEYKHVCFEDKNLKVALNIPGQSQKLDIVLEKVVSHPKIKEVLQAVLGTDYKLWQVNIRQATPGGRGLQLHQDANGETGLSILLSETPGLEGTTIFWPGTHRLPIRVLNTGLPAIPLKFFRPFLSGATGKPGDLHLFFNRTWHGRYPHDPFKSNIAILMSFFPVGTSYRIQEPSPELLGRLGPELKRLLDPHSGVRRLPDGKALVIGQPRRYQNTELERIVTGQFPVSPLSPWQILKIWGFILEIRRNLWRQFKNLVKRCLGRPETDYRTI